MQILSVPWLQLPGQQNVLVQADFSQDKYAIRVTDLQNIWGEDVLRDEIESRAEEVNCPIDPTTNLKDLLEKLQDALTVDAKSTSIFLRRSGDRLLIQTTEYIGSTAIKWPFRLEALPFAAVALGLSLSLFSMMSFYQREVTSLLDVIEEKDVVIRQMCDFMKTTNHVFKPNRRQKAFKPFAKKEWRDQCRLNAKANPKSSQQVVDELSLVGREHDFRKDWQAVLSEISHWDIQFLPQTTERTPTRVTSSIQSRSKDGRAHEVLQAKPKMLKEDTEVQSHTFLTPRKVHHDKPVTTKIHTKWSSPVHSSQVSSELGNVQNHAQASRDHTSAYNEVSRNSSTSPSPSPTPMKSHAIHHHLEQKRREESITPKYKMKDNRESQELEEDLDMQQSQSSQGRSPEQVLVTEVQDGERDDDTTDESDGDGGDLKMSGTSTPTFGNTDRRDPSRSLSKGDGHESSQGSPMGTPLSETSAAVASKPRVLNLISPRKPRVEQKVHNIVAPKHKNVEPQSLNTDPEIDTEELKKDRALKKRREAEQLMQQSPTNRKKTRKF